MNFDINKCPLDDNGHRLCQTRDGRKVRIICTDANRNGYPIVALVEFPNGMDEIWSFTATGQFYCGDGLPPSRSDLTNIPVEHERTYWLVHRRDGDMVVCRDRPDNLFLKSEVAITGPHVVRFKEGEGLEAP